MTDQQNISSVIDLSEKLMLKVCLCLPSQLSSLLFYTWLHIYASFRIYVPQMLITIHFSDIFLLSIIELAYYTRWFCLPRVYLFIVRSAPAFNISVLALTVNCFVLNIYVYMNIYHEMESQWIKMVWISIRNHLIKSDKMCVNNSHEATERL